MGVNKPDSSRGRNQIEALEVDRTHIDESTKLCRKANTHLESLRPKKKMRTNEHMHGKNEQHLDRTRREGRGQSGLENAGWRPMLHWR
ncbi:unnamed protein product [Schistosoma curassoni]|uniref:Uncharacterized protein n=1 Tax=Schistosoma curassoni TaxID=6186 RepID=A0A183K205_9TREM|nr:unnamed protein product [Schistosoma curassoni]